MNSQTFGEKLKALRQKFNYTLKYVGNQIDYSPVLLSKIERNQKKAPAHLIEPMSKVYGIPYRELMLKYLSEDVYYQLREFDFANDVLKIVEQRIYKEGKGNSAIKSRKATIKAIKKYFSDKPVERVWVFGSFAKLENVSGDSDIDIMVTFKKPNKITLFDLIQMKDDLRKRTGRSIDLVEEGQELESFKSNIYEERVLVYGS